jgi:hypothetical protein
MAAASWPTRLASEVRAGLNTGECEGRGDEIGGIGVRIGGRVRALAGPTDVLVSSTLRDLVIRSGPEFDDRARMNSRACPASGASSPSQGGKSERRKEVCCNATGTPLLVTARVEEVRVRRCANARCKS